MALGAAFFFLFSTVLVVASLMVVAARNPVHGVLFLILAFFNAAGLFILIGAEFLAMILVVVYVGAVAVLFLFVVMMLDVDYVALAQGFWRYMPIAALVGVVLLAEITVAIVGWASTDGFQVAIAGAAGDITEPSNVRRIGLVLYTRHVYYFQASGLILLVAMVGAIVLSLRHKPHVRRQIVAEQVGRTREASVELRKVKPNEGLPS